MEEWLIGTVIAACVVPALIILSIIIYCLYSKYRINWYQATILDNYKNEQAVHLLINDDSESTSSEEDNSKAPVKFTIEGEAVDSSIQISSPSYVQPKINPPAAGTTGPGVKKVCRFADLPEEMGAEESVLDKIGAQEEKSPRSHHHPARRQSAPIFTHMSAADMDKPFKKTLTVTKSVPLDDAGSAVRRQSQAGVTQHGSSRTTPECPLSPIRPPGRLLNRRRASMQDAIDVSLINASLYEKESVSQRAIHEESSVDLKEPIGILHMSVSLNQDTYLLKVTIHKADLNGFESQISLRSPYFAIHITGCESKTLKTKPADDPVHMNINENFVFEIGEDLTEKKLICTLYDYDQFIKTDEIGIVSLRLSTIPLDEPLSVQKHIDRYQVELENRIEDYAGQILFSVCYQKNMERLSFVISKAKDLNVEEITRGLIVKIAVNSQGKKVKKKRTESCKVSSNPSWYQAIQVLLTPDLLDGISITIDVCKDQLSGHDVIGRVVLDKDSAGKELNHWRDLQSKHSHTSSLEWWHNLHRVEKSHES